MRLVASLIVGNEAARYLDVCLDVLAECCDTIAVIDDGSTDGTHAILADRRRLGRVEFRRNETPLFDFHEGRARQALLEWTLEHDPTHVLTIDADELVEDPVALRRLLETDRRSLGWMLQMEEVWELDGDCMCVRVDGGWRPKPITAVWRVPVNPASLRRPEWRIQNRPLACGREPIAVRRLRPTVRSGLSLFHMGWTNPHERRRRFDRYMRIDGGSYHARRHLESIMWPENRIQLVGRPWPLALEPRRELVTARTVTIPA